MSELRLAEHEDPSHIASYRLLAACYAHLGRLAEAGEIVARLRVITAKVMPATGWHHLRNPEHCELCLSGLRLAMGEDSMSRPGRANREQPKITHHGGSVA